ncbi:hypothetical protein F4810DRAFT_677487 [Camillea tinctor]|nr:hypothetical protein F4810DRAFT_677487 [Camillea tinctor]
MYSVPTFNTSGQFIFFATHLFFFLSLPNTINLTLCASNTAATGSLCPSAQLLFHLSLIIDTTSTATTLKLFASCRVLHVLPAARQPSVHPSFCLSLPILI